MLFGSLSRVPQGTRICSILTQQPPHSNILDHKVCEAALQHGKKTHLVKM
jgi:hypothetical protein